jgi:hypothetical protein
MVDSIVILGGLSADASSEFAMVGDVHVQRGACEDVETFKARVMALSEATNRPAIFGGLPPIDRDDGASS